jgi:hypothetical protein
LDLTLRWIKTAGFGVSMRSSPQTEWHQ